MYALVDCNNFYASCERVFNPRLQHKPIAILSNNDGCVIARSDEAKALNLPMGAPIFKWEPYCKANNIEILSSNYPLYGDMSQRVMSILAQFTPDIEVYSIDEAFLEFKGFKNTNFNDYGIQIRKRVLKWTGLPTCVGIAPTKALTKVANKIARKFPKQTQGVHVIDTHEKRIKALKWMNIEDVWGIGRGLQKKLKAKGCTKAYHFTQLPDQWVLKNLSITGWRLKKDLEGQSQIKLDEIEKKRAIATTRSFEYTYSNVKDIKERVSTFATICAEKLRKQGSSCHIIYVSLRSDKHKTDSKQHRETRAVSLSYPTNSSLIISQQAVHLAAAMFQKGVKYKGAGVIVMGLEQTTNQQLNMFYNQDPKHQPLMQTIDYLNAKYAKHKIKLASQDLQRTWKMRQERLSPRYTTNINDIIVVK